MEEDKYKVVTEDGGVLAPFVTSQNKVFSLELHIWAMQFVKS